MAEWLKAAVLKTVVPLRGPWVRILPPPPNFYTMKEVNIQRAEKEDFSYIKEKLKNYILDSENASWEQFFVAKYKDKTVAFGRIINREEYFEIASIGVDYYNRKKGIGKQMLFFLVEEAKRLDPKRPIYGITHRPGFLKRAGFKEITSAPEALEYKKKYNKCVRDPSKIKVMKLI